MYSIAKAFGEFLLLSLGVLFVTHGCLGGEVVSRSPEEDLQALKRARVLVQQRDVIVHDLFEAFRRDSSGRGLAGLARIEAAQTLAELGEVRIIPLLIEEVTYRKGHVTLEVQGFLGRYPMALVLMHENLRHCTPHRIVQYLGGTRSNRINQEAIDVLSHLMLECFSEDDGGSELAFHLVRRALESPNTLNAERLKALEDGMKRICSDRY